MFNKIKKTILAGSLLLSVSANAQVSPHYSQYYSNPLWLNPALTGVIDGDYRVTALYRSQWGDIGNGFKTPGVSADVRLTDNLAVGGHLLDQTAGTAGYHFTNGYASVAYTGLKFGANGYHQISLGLSGGFINRRFDQSKFQTGEQWNPATGFDPSVVSSEAYGKTSATAFDAGFGALYFDGTPGKKVNIYAGVSAFHLTQPTDAFITGGNHEKLPIRYSVHAGAKINLSDKFSLTPNAMDLRQGNAGDKVVGVNAQINAGAGLDVIFGANYRFDDAVIPQVGLLYKNISFGFSYDANTSTLGKNISNANAFEFSITLLGRKKGSVNTTPFVCPRL